jgi:hypothetical protein
MAVTIPSRNPADDGPMAGVLKVVARKNAENTDSQLPAIVIDYDRTLNTATVLPLIDRVQTNGEVMPRAQLASVPVLALGGGGFCITFPLQPGDFGWIEASDRDISLFLQNMAESAPNTFRIHSFDDARFIPDVFHQYTYSDDDAGNMVIQSLDGMTKVAIGPGIIVVKADSVSVTSASVTITSDATAVVGSSFTYNGSQVATS